MRYGGRRSTGAGIAIRVSATAAIASRPAATLLPRTAPPPAGPSSLTSIPSLESQIIYDSVGSGIGYYLANTALLREGGQKRTHISSLNRMATALKTPAEATAINGTHYPRKHEPLGWSCRKFISTTVGAATHPLLASPDFAAGRRHGSQGWR